MTLRRHYVIVIVVYHAAVIVGLFLVIDEAPSLRWRVSSMGNIHK